MKWLRLVPLAALFAFFIWDSNFLTTKILAFVVFLAAVGMSLYDFRKRNGA